MILLCDSGSTKTDWALVSLDFEIVDRFSTMGLNPYFHDQEVVERAIRGDASMMAVAKDITHVFFYGAGSSTNRLCSIIREGLERVFVEADVRVDHDLVGAAYATYSGEPGITCILGTGSNSCYFDGKYVSEEVPSLAYILGDESSGSYFGKRLLRAYFYKLLPADLVVAFDQEHYAPTKDEMINRVYNESDANVYLASFMKFLGKHKDHPWVVNLIEEGMRHFINIHVKCFDDWKKVPVHFIGSIGFYFQHCLETVARESGIRLGSVIQKPIDGLVGYHAKYKKAEIRA